MGADGRIRDRARAGDGSTVVLVGTALVLLAAGGVMFTLVSSQKQAEAARMAEDAAAASARTAAASAREQARGGPRLAAPTEASGGGGDSERSAVPSGEGDEAVGEARAELDQLLSSFYDTTAPDVGALRVLTASLGAEAELVPGSLARDAGVWSGRLHFPSIGREGEFTLDGNSIDVELQQTFGERDYFMRRLNIFLGVDRGLLAEGVTGVFHDIDYRDTEVMDGLLEEPRAVGWRLAVSLNGGNEVSPFLAVTRENDAGGMELVAGAHALEDFDEEQVPGTIRDEGAFDLSPWYGWRDFHTRTLAQAEGGD